MKIKKYIGAAVSKLKTWVGASNWSDPVIGNVISAGIIGALGILGSGVWILISSLYHHIPLKASFNHYSQLFLESTMVPNWLILFFLFGMCLLIFPLLGKIPKRADSNVTDEEPEPPHIYESSTSFFSYRLSSAFPGVRGFQWFDDPKEAVKRLELVFKPPITFNRDVKDPAFVSDPIWWFREDNSNIEEFERLSKTKIRFGHKELEIKRIAVHIDPSYYKCYIYVEAKGEKQSGVNNLTEVDFQRQQKNFGYCYEEFGLLGKQKITREEYDDGAALIKGKVVNATNAQARVRHLSDYNLLIAAKQSPYNSRKLDMASKEIFNSIISGTQDAQILFDFLKTLERHDSMMYSGH